VTTLDTHWHMFYGSNVCSAVKDGACDCDGNSRDHCGVCGGPGMPGDTLDVCGVCGGPGVPAGKCDCYDGTACLASEHGTLISATDETGLMAAYSALKSG